MQSTGVWFTWFNNICENDLVLERLDKGFSNEKRKLQYPLSHIHYFPVVASDHVSILLDTIRKHAYKPHVFRFQNMWLLNADCNEIVAKAWNKP